VGCALCWERGVSSILGRGLERDVPPREKFDGMPLTCNN